MIMEALRQKDRVKAVEAVVGHISKTKKFLQELVFKLKAIGVNPSKIPINELNLTNQQKEDFDVETK